MESFDLERFALIALAEALFYDEEYGAIGTVSLINDLLGREAFIASFSPEDEVFLVEEATEWETFLPNGDDDIGYKLAVDSKPYATCDSPMEAAEVLLRLAADGNLQPSVSLMFEVDDPTDD
jgi:hypothetical protein